MRLLCAIMLFILICACSKNPMGTKGKMDPEHRPYLEAVKLNNIPYIDDQIFSGLEDQILLGQLTAYDDDQDILEYEMLVNTQNGLIFFDTNNGEFQYTPNSNFFGIDFFSVRAFDGENYSASKTIFLTVLEQTDISGSILITEVRENSVKVSFSSLAVDSSANISLCISEDTNGDEIADVAEYCNIANSTTVISETGSSSTWSDVEFLSSTLGFSLDACTDKKIFISAQITGTNNSQTVVSQLAKKVGWSPACLTSSGIAMWLDAQKLSSVSSNYATTGINGTGALNSNVVTTSSNPRSLIPVYSRVRIDGAVYDVTATTTSSISVSPALSTAVSARAISVLTVSEWKDQTTNNHNAVQNTALLQPYLSYNGIAGLPSILSNGQTRGLSVSGLTYNEFSIFMITRELDVTNDVRSYIAKRGAVGAHQFIFSYSIYAKRIAWDQTGDTSRVDTGFLPQVNTNYLYNWTRKTGENRYQYVNGTLNYSTSSNNDLVNTHRLDIGHENHAALRSINGFISEVLIFNQHLTQDNREKIEGYLAWRWGMQASLPALHPYKTQMP